MSTHCKFCNLSTEETYSHQKCTEAIKEMVKKQAVHHKTGDFISQFPFHKKQTIFYRHLVLPTNDLTNQTTP